MNKTLNKIFPLLLISIFLVSCASANSEIVSFLSDESVSESVSDINSDIESLSEDTLSDSTSEEISESEIVSQEPISEEISEPLSTLDSDKLLDKWEALEVYKYSYNLGEDVMPINAWIAPISISGYNTDEQYKYVKEAGLNTVYNIYDTLQNERKGEIYKALEHAENNDVKLIFQDSTLLTRCNVGVDAVKLYLDSLSEYKSFAGFFGRDEPSTELFHNLFLQNYGMKLADKNFLYYMNLFPNYANFETQLIADSYEEYVERFITEVKPLYVSYDFYGNAFQFPTVTHDYFGQLDTVSSLCQKYHLPFWTFACTTAHGSLRVPTQSDIFWQVNTDLAYGAKGIQYFCYQTPYEWTHEGGSLIDDKGNRTDVYYICQKINKQIERMDHILMNSTSIGKMVYNNSPRPIESESLSSCREIKSIETEDDLLVGCFDHHGKSCFYFVNNNLVNNLTCKVNFTNYIEANTYDVNENNIVKGETSEISLGPGEAILYELTNYKS